MAKMNSQSYMVGDEGKKDGLALHQQRVTEAVKWRDNAKYDETWARLIKLYGNKYDYAELDTYSDIIAPNMAFSTVNVIVPGVSVNYPKITVKARQEVQNQAAMTVEAVANYEWQHNDVHEEFRLAIKDFVVLGHGLCKVTWLYVEGQREWTQEAFQQEATNRVSQLGQDIQSAAQSGVPTHDFPTVDDVVNAIPAKETYAKEDRPNVERISPFDFFIDPDATRIKNALWVAQRLYIPIDTARNNDAWSSKARSKLNPTAMSEAKKDIDIMYEGEERGKETNYVVVWEYYDLLNGTVCTFADGAEDYLLKPEPVPLPFDHPFVMLRNYDVPDKLYPLGDVEAIAPLQIELAMTRTQMINDRKRYRRMYLYRPEAIGEDGVSALLSGDDNAMIKVEGSEPFADVLAPLGTSNLPPEFYNQTSMILEDINLVSGVSEYQRGNQPEIRRTATEAAMINDGSNARAADKLAIVERAIGEIAERVVKLTQEFLTADSVARIIGPDGASQWVQYDAESLKGDYDFTVEAGSTQPQNESSRRQAALQLMDAMAPYIGTVVDPRKMAEYVLREGFGVKNPMDFMIDPNVLMASGINPATGQPLPPPPGMEPGGPPAGGPPQGPPQG